MFTYIDVVNVRMFMTLRLICNITVIECESVYLYGHLIDEAPQETAKLEYLSVYVALDARGNKNMMW